MAAILRGVGWLLDRAILRPGAWLLHHVVVVPVRWLWQRPLTWVWRNLVVVSLTWLRAGIVWIELRVGRFIGWLWRNWAWTGVLAPVGRWCRDDVWRPVAQTLRSVWTALGLRR